MTECKGFTQPITESVEHARAGIPNAIPNSFRMKLLALSNSGSKQQQSDSYRYIQELLVMDCNIINSF